MSKTGWSAAVQTLATVRHLKLSQIYFYLVRRGLGYRSVVGRDVVKAAGNLEALHPPIALHAVYAQPATFTFLNTCCDVSDGLGSIDWQPASVQRLWAYNLHYFDYLRQPMSSQVAKNLIESWIDCNEQGTQPGWEPFTVSLRIVNWTFWLAKNPEQCEEKILRSLHLQAAWLDKNDERHILANHYFENLKALAFAGCFFTGKQAIGWRTRAINGLKTELKEQFLQDGGHYERSPMYHSLMLENCLDLYNLVQSAPSHFQHNFVTLLRNTCEQSLQWLQVVATDKGDIPLLNDSALGVAPKLEQLQEYGAECGVTAQHQSNGNCVLDLGESGLLGYKNGGDYFVLDCGEVGPGYQPGHTHCDFLSIVLEVDGVPIIVDTGVKEYEPGSNRKYVRSTAAHNVYTVDDAEQSSVWGEFRVAQRAKKSCGTIGRSGDSINIHGAFSGFPSIGWIEHHRNVLIDLEQRSHKIKSIQVQDVFRGESARQERSLVGRLLFHPDVACEMVSEHQLRLSTLADGKPLSIDVTFDARLQCALERREYFPQFGIALQTTGAVFRCVDLLPSRINFELSITRSHR